MAKEPKVKIISLCKRNTVSIPIKFIREMELVPGDIFQAEIVKGSLVMTPVKVTDRWVMPAST